jgi:GTP pyrophosphokinase
VIVDDIKDCYTVLGIVHHIWQPIPRSSTTTSRPKPNGYKSLHTVVIGDDGRAFECRSARTKCITSPSTAWPRTGATRKPAARLQRQFSASDKYDEKIAWLRQLLAWKDDADHGGEARRSAVGAAQASLDDDHIYVLTPQARVIALPQGATPVDFAYHLHSELGHRCRGARVDGAMVPLNTPLANGQTVEIVAVKQGGPSRDWLNPQLGYLKSSRARQKVRAWFNSIEQEENIAQGARCRKDAAARGQDVGQPRRSRREARLQVARRSVRGRRQGRVQPAQHRAGAVRCAAARARARGARRLREAQQRRERGARRKTGVLVVGVDALLTQLARCCRRRRPTRSRLRDARQGDVDSPQRLPDLRADGRARPSACCRRRGLRTCWAGAARPSIRSI